jgi:hypothetical protein
MAYESRWEQFEALGRDGERFTVAFLKAGFLTIGDCPELYFFRVAGAISAERTAAGETKEIVVGISGDSLKRFQQGRKYLSREAKVDLAGLLLKKRIETGMALESKNLFLRDEELAQLAGELGIPV